MKDLAEATGKRFEDCWQGGAGWSRTGKGFGTPEQQAKAGQAEQAYNIVQDAGCTGATAKKSGTRLRKMMA